MDKLKIDFRLLKEHKLILKKFPYAYADMMQKSYLMYLFNSYLVEFITKLGLLEEFKENLDDSEKEVFKNILNVIKID